MKNVLVEREFYDKYNHSRLFQPGEVVAFEDSRADNIVELGLGKIIPESEEEPDVDKASADPSPESEDKPKKKRKAAK